MMKKFVTALLLFSFSINLANSLEGNKVSNSRIKMLNGKYSNDKFISNFVGFFPVNNPQLLSLIILDEPKQPYHWGGQGAAVAFKRIMKRIINMDDSISPPYKEKSDRNFEIVKITNKNKLIPDSNKKADLIVSLSVK